LNGLDPVIRRLSPAVKSRCWYFGQREPGEPGADLENEGLRLSLPETACAHPEIGSGALTSPTSFLLDLSRFKPAGKHNRENACAAALAAMAAGGTRQGIQAVLERFSGEAHRMEPVATIAGVDYVNDSKATNVDAVARALETYAPPVVLIMGGLDKGANFHALNDALRQRVRRLIVFGAAADKILTALSAAVPVIRVSAMSEAVRAARKVALAGDVVLLSPGCASFDMYTSYAERGEDFRREVLRLRSGKQ
jgi:UDP-N-acetylmuramoylalanine--D-glutamate ligase